VRGHPEQLEIDETVRSNGGRIEAAGRPKLGLADLQAHCGRVKADHTIDSMVFDCTRREAHVTRRAGGVTPWKRFGFEA
jgi:hypothetical protein